MKYLFLLCLLLGVVMAQPCTFTPTNTSAVIRGQLTVGGAAADPGDYLIARDSSGNCAGAMRLILDGGASFINLTIYGDDATTPNVDEGINPGEAFFLELYDSSTNAFLPYPNACDPTAFSGWQNNNGAPLPGYDDTNTRYAFPTVLDASIMAQTELCENDPTQLLSGMPAGGLFSGLGVAGGRFVPELVGPGTYTVRYTATDSLTCQVNTDSLAIEVKPAPSVTFNYLPEVCLNDEPRPLVGGSPRGGEYTGMGIDDNRFVPALAGAGLVRLVYTLTAANGCFDTASFTVRVLDAPPTPSIFVQSSNTLAAIAPGATQYSWLRNGQLISGQSGATLTVTQPGDYRVIAGNDDCPSDTSAVFTVLNTNLNARFAREGFWLTPTATDRSLQLGFTRTPIRPVHVEIWDAVGRRHFTRTYPAANRLSVKQLNLSPGVYYCRFVSGGEMGVRSFSWR